jgi:outer membrane protein TolC
MEEQQKQLKLLKEELAVNLRRAEGLKNNGVAMSTDLDMIRVEQINVEQRELEVANTRKSYLQLLAAFIGVPYSSGMLLEKPILPQLTENQANNRPELKLFDAQINLLESQQEALKAANLPKIGIFAQGGYGRPGLNMFVNAFSPFAIGGIKLSWQLGNFYTTKNNLQKISLNQEQVSIQRETFLFNNSLQDKQQLNEIERLRETLKNDDELIRLRSGIKKSAQAKWENGTLTTSDLMREVNAENMAKQTKSLHEMQLYLATYQLMTTSNQTSSNTH